MATDDYVKELEFAKKVALEAGKIVMSFANSKIIVNFKGVNDPVTNADMASDNFIKESIRREFPLDSILTEESIDDLTRIKNSRVWIIDPIDGTANFKEYALSNQKSQEYRYFGVHIALAVNNKPVVGVLYAPATKELFYASKGMGSFVTQNGDKPKKLETTPRKKPQGYLIGTFYSDKRFKENTDKYPQKERPWKRVFGYTTISILKNEIDVIGYYFDKFSVKEWDACAPHIIIEEAGGSIKDIFGNELIYNKEIPIFKDGVIVQSNEGYFVFLKK